MRLNPLIVFAYRSCDENLKMCDWHIWKCKERLKSVGKKQWGLAWLRDEKRPKEMRKHNRELQRNMIVYNNSNCRAINTLSENKNSNTILLKSHVEKFKNLFLENQRPWATQKLVSKIHHSSLSWLLHRLHPQLFASLSVQFLLNVTQSCYQSKKCFRVGDQGWLYKLLGKCHLTKWGMSQDFSLHCLNTLMSSMCKHMTICEKKIIWIATLNTEKAYVYMCYIKDISKIEIFWLSRNYAQSIYLLAGKLGEEILQNLTNFPFYVFLTDAIL